ncbi:enoyl-CoA hydratase/isomerase family protein [Actinomadura sp. B10D3]|uniref:enoyl-CoA hydratase/isomerase family protein n=1 Tax=Actinomadura sp. B10D3 TaxID=3153557 RepID=UPI00325CDFED
MIIGRIRRPAGIRIQGGRDPMAGPMHISVADLAGGAAAVPLFGPDGEVHDPLLIVDLESAAPPTVERAARQARSSDRLLVGLAKGEAHPELVRALDLTVAGPVGGAGRGTVAVADPQERVGLLYEAAERNPQATLVLRDVLRTTEGMPVPAALDVESYAYSTLLGGAEFARWLGTRGPRTLPPEAADPVLLVRDAGHLRITLNRPERRNAYGRQLRDALADALRLAVLDEEIGQVVLDGTGPAFCSGGDLAEFGTTPDLTTAHLVRTRAGAGRLIHQLRHRMEVHVHGSCVGAGAELPAFAGRIVARPDASFRLPEISMGLIPGAGGTVSIPRRIGRWRTLYIALSGGPLDAHAALAWGLIDEMAP